MPTSKDRLARKTNEIVASLLQDMAALQTEPQRRWAYRRAAEAIRSLTAPLESLVGRDGKLRKIANVGPSSERIVLEVVATGESATVARAIADNPRGGHVVEGRALSEHFLDAGQVAAVLADRTIDAIGLDDYRGDLQMHSTWSDGSASLERIADGCLARGYRYCAVTDHSYGLPIAHGVSMADLARRNAEIDDLNRRRRGRFRMLKAIEGNILADGSVDMTFDELGRLELVVAAPHSGLRSTGDQTTRMVAAVRAPGVHVIGHPRGRKIATRPGISADWERVFAAAAAAGVALEIDGDPRRQDLDHTLAVRAVAAGCVIAIDSDAHAVAELSFVECGVAHARLAGIPAERVINTWPLERLLAWARAKRKRDASGIGAATTGAARPLR